MSLKRYISILIAAILAVASVGMAAFAADDNYYGECYNITEFDGYDLEKYCYELVEPDNADEVFTLPVYESSEDYKSWSQSDSRWGSIQLGGGDTCSLSGCLVSAITKLIIQSGLRNQDSFNIATFLNYLNSVNAFSDSNLKWASVNSFDPNFQYSKTLFGVRGSSTTYSSVSYNNTIIDFLNQGYHIVLDVGGHWVAVDEAKTFSSGTVYIMDNRYNGTLADKYTTFKRIEGFVGGQSQFENSSEITISGANVPDYLWEGNVFSIKGDIFSGMALTNVTVGCYDVYGNAAIECSASPASCNYNVYSLDKYLEFNVLPAGAYQYKITASNSEITTVLVNKPFLVHDNEKRISDGTYEIKSVVNSSYLVSVNGVESGSNVQLGSDTNDPTQTWLIRHEGDGYYSIRNYATGLYLTVVDESSQAGANIQQSSNEGSTAQRWHIIPAGNTYIFSPECALNNCMDIYSSVMSDGTNITNYSFSFTSNQQFTLSQNNGFFPSGNKITFDACGGTLPSAYDSYIPDNYNTGRGEGELIVYNVPDSVAYTNKYGVEVLAEADGRVSAKREYSSSEQFTVPINGMVISAHFDAAGTAAAFINGVSIGDYVGCDYDNNIVYAYDSIDAYLANHKYVPSGSAYGTLPTPTRSGYIFDGWYTASSDGTEITSDSVYSASKLYAHWKAEDANIPGLKITSQPVDYTGKIGDTAKFTVSANNEHVTYQWQQNTGAGWTNINTTVGRSKTFSIAIAQFRLNYKYRCVVSDGTNIITSDEVKMVVNEEFKITTQPTNFTGKIGDTAKFTVEANGENLTYQWEQDTGNGWTAINTTAGRSKTFSIAIAQFRLGYKYRCVVSNGTDSLTSDEVQMVVAETLAITSQPTNYTGTIGDTAKFIVTATGATSYQWQQNTGAGWANINTSVGRSKTFSLGVTAARANYQYRCVVSDGTTSLTTNAVKMVIDEDLAIVSQPSNYIGAIGSTAKFTVEATGATSYQWYQNTGNGWTAINTTAGRSNTFSIAIAQFRLGYLYRCVVSDGTNEITSDEVQMYIG